MRLFISLFALISTITLRASLIVGGSAYTPCTVTPESSSGLEAIYVIYDVDGTTLSYRSDNPAGVKWSRFSSLGGAYSEPVAALTDGNLSTITPDPRDMGYIVEADGRQHCYWVVNYADHQCRLNSASVNEAESDCSMTAIDIDGEANKITYYTITGIPRELSRDISVEYASLRWDENSENYLREDITTSLASISGMIRVTAPLCDTEFTISGDRFLSEWGHGESVATSTFHTNAVEAHTSATQATRENDNEISDDSADLGGSAPAEVTFSATVTDAVEFREWQFSRFADFDIIDLRYNEEEVTYTFRDNGTTYVRFIAANAAGDCEWTGDTYEVSIGESQLLCPNAFSPGASEGVNDEWKVSYKSIVDFECHIFNRWGVKLFSTTNPAEGWDGKYGGKVVPAGVYFYIIKARGADGKDYSLSGDINVINYKTNSNTPEYTE